MGKENDVLSTYKLGKTIRKINEKGPVISMTVCNASVIIFKKKSLIFEE